MAILPGSPPVGPFSATAPARLLPPQTRPATRPRRGWAASPSPNWPPSNRSAASSSTSNSGRPTTPSTTPLTLAATNPTNSSSGSRSPSPGCGNSSWVSPSSATVPCAASPNCSRMSLTIRCRSAPFTTSCTRPSPLHAPSPLGKTSLPSASAPTTRSSRPAGLCWSAPDVASTYCYLLSSEEHRDADTWGVRLLELSERSFRPDATIADFAGGLRAGQAEALPDVPCRGDVFHALQTATPLVGYLENRAYEAIATRSRLENRQARRRAPAGPQGCVAGRATPLCSRGRGAGGDPRRRRGPVGPLAPARRAGGARPRLRRPLCPV